MVAKNSRPSRRRFNVSYPHAAPKSPLKDKGRDIKGKGDGKHKTSTNDSPQFDEDRILTLSRLAWSCYKDHEYMEALSHYDNILEFTSSSAERASLYRKVNAYVMFRKGMCHEWLGDLITSMDYYCDALKMYTRCRERSIHQNRIDTQRNIESSKSPFSSTPDEIDKQMSAILAQMANVQMKLGNMEFAIQLYLSALKRLRDIGGRSGSTNGEGEKDVEMMNHIIELLHNVMEIQIMRGDYEAAEQARAESLKLQTRLALIQNTDQFSMGSTLTDPETLKAKGEVEDRVITNIFKVKTSFDEDYTVDEETFDSTIESDNVSVQLQKPTLTGGSLCSLTSTRCGGQTSKLDEFADRTIRKLFNLIEENEGANK